MHHEKGQREFKVCVIYQQQKKIQDFDKKEKGKTQKCGSFIIRIN